jgi:hypothetical protein
MLFDHNGTDHNKYFGADGTYHPFHRSTTVTSPVAQGKSGYSMMMEFNFRADSAPNGNAEFLVQFARTGSLFDLPDGWNVNSDDGCIADNHYVCGLNSINARNAQAQILEPSSILTLMVGIAGLAALAYRPKSNSRKMPLPHPG